MKETKDKNKGRGILCSQMSRLSIIKTSVPPNLMYRFNTIPAKLQANYFVNIKKIYLKADMERQKIANAILQEKNKFGD